jgi:hypothetical protein
MERVLRLPREQFRQGDEDEVFYMGRKDGEYTSNKGEAR